MPSRNAKAGAHRRPGAPDSRGGREGTPVDAATIALERLRPGRDSHSRDKVDGIQRARIVSAMAEVVTEQGLPAATVANVVARAGVSRRTFYELFADREECFLAAFDHAAGLAAAAVLREYQQPGAWRDRIRAGLLALLEFLDEEPSLGALCVVHSLGAGPLALERRGHIVDALIAAVDEGRETQSGRKGGRRDATTTAPLTAEGVVGAVLAVVHARLVQPGSQAMVELLGPLMHMIVLPYQGAAAANRELARPAPKGRVKPRRPAGDPLKDLDMRLTYRTVRVLIAIATTPRASNRQIGDAAGIADQGQISKLLQRLTSLGLIENTGAGHSKGEANAWQLTGKGLEVERTIRSEATPSSAG